MDFEESLQKGLFTSQSEKTFIDKLLAKDDVNRVSLLIKKPNLTREELLELLYLLSGTEVKLLNFGAWDRYINSKFFVWIREFIKIAELMYDYKELLLRKINTCKACGKRQDTDKSKDKCKCKTFMPQMTLTSRGMQILANNERLIEHNAKFLIDLYFNIGRSTLSIGGTGIMELLKNRYEIVYPAQNAAKQPENKQAGLTLRK